MLYIANKKVDNVFMRSLQSINRIRYCPSFVDFQPATDLPPFAKYNLIYGWNGSGKTSLSRILRSFELELNAFDDATNTGQFEFKLDDRTTINQENLSAYKEIRVFNKDFIEDTVFCQGGPKALFYIGKESKESKEKINQAETELATLTKDASTKDALLTKATENKDKLLSAKAKEIKVALTTAKPDAYRTYEKTEIEKALRNNAEALKTPATLILSDNKLVETKKTIQQTSKEKINPVSVPNFNVDEEVSETTSLLQRTVTSQVIENLKSDEEISKWVEHGLGIHKRKALSTCAFCNQTIPTERLTALENHFNAEYQKTLNEISSLRGKLHARKIFTTFIDSSKFYEDFSAEYLVEQAKAKLMMESFNNNIDSILVALDQKQLNLFKQPVMPILQPIESVPFTTVNEVIDKHNKRTDNFDEQINANKTVLEHHHLAEFMTDYTASVDECKRLDDEHKTAKNTVQLKNTEIKTLKEGLISHHIPAQQINKDLESFLGRADIQLKATDAEDGGYQIMRNEEVVKNLSEGERTALAILYFIAKVKEDGFDIKNSLIVIDDPVSSLDANALYLAFSFIKESIKEAGQIIILTHHFDFFRLTKNWFQHVKPNGNVAYFMTACKVDASVRKSSLIKLDPLLINFESEYHFLFSILYRFAEKKEKTLEELYPLPNVARKFLESFLAFRVPIGKGVTNIHARLEHIDFDAVKKTRINRFVETHSHPRYETGVQDFDMTLLGEAPDVISDLIAMVKNEDDKHYIHLVNSIS